MSDSNRDYRCAIPQRGRIELVDGKLLCYEDTPTGRVLRGEILMGPNRYLYVNGVELSLAQKGDPGKLRFVVEDETGANAGGVISANRFRPGDPDYVQEEVAQINLHAQPGTFLGVIRMLVRVGGENDWRNAFVATTQYANQLWTGAANWRGWLWKEANADDDPPQAPGVGVAIPSRFQSDDGRYVYNVQGDPTPDFPHGRIVQYDTHFSADPALWTAVAIVRPEALAPPEAATSEPDAPPAETDLDER